MTHRVEEFTGICGNGCLHAYKSWQLGLLTNPAMEDFAISHPHVWRSETPKILGDNGIKIGCAELTTIERIEVPEPTTEQCVEFAIRCAWEVCDEPEWRPWATAWLDGTDRSEDAGAAWAARTVAWAAAHARAARAAVWAARAARAARAADAGADVNAIAVRVMGDADVESAAAAEAERGA